MPKSEKRNAGMRGWPVWAQDVVYGLIHLRMKAANRGKRFEFGKDKEMKM